MACETAHGQPCAPCINDASGVRPKAAPGGPERPILLHRRSGNRRRRSRRRGAATAIEWRTVRPEPQAVVRSTLPKAKAAVSALVRAPVHGAVRSEVRSRSAGARARVQRALRRGVREPVCGEAGTGDARSAPGRARGDARSRRSRPGRARRGLRRALREAPARGGRGGSPNEVVERCAAAAVQHAAESVSEPPGKRTGARSERSERRREGYPPEGSRPRSGLGRVARSRSDAPSLIVVSGETASSIGTIGCITVCTVVVSIGVTAIGKITITITTAITGHVAGARRTLLSSTARR